MTLKILNYKNKSDRIARHGIDDMSNVNDYQDYVLYTIPDIQFNKGDGLVTTQIVNLDVTDNGNYLLALDGEDIIQSRWYIVESRWLRAGQTQLTLARDVVDDYLDKVFYGDSIIERAMLSSYTNPLIYNEEPIKVNQIKTSETLLKDETGMPWLIMYIAKGETLDVNTDDIYVNGVGPHTAPSSEPYYVDDGNLPPDFRAFEADGGYDMVATPYANVSITTIVGNTINLDERTTLLTYQNIAKKNAGKVYDIQLLPYCPCRTSYEYDGTEWQATDYSIVPAGNTYVVLFNVADANQSFTLFDYGIPSSATPIGRKKGLICDKYRLCDPGYNGVFEFSVEKNNGLNEYTVDMTVKPYQPFIHIAPNFGGLYGRDFNDARGLTLGSNFSITTTSDRFAEYEIQNKNYQEMFNRQIQNMEVQHDLQKAEAIAQIVAGTASAGTQGGTAGMLLGGGVGGAVGAGIGAATSLAAGIADVAILEKRQAEELAYAQDMHNFQLDNIKALPDSLTRVSIFNNIYKNFPFVEYYTCTDEEKQVVENYIKWNSMNVNAIGRIADYVQDTQTFIKAIPLRLSIPEDDHVAVELARELSRGFYI